MGFHEADPMAFHERFSLKIGIPLAVPGADTDDTTVTWTHIAAEKAPERG